MNGYNPATRLKDHTRSMANRNCHRSEVLEVLRLSRLVLEHDRSALQFPHLSLYCDWFVHGAIDRKPLGSKILELVNDAIRKHWENSDGLVTGISRCLSLAELRHEMIIFLITCGAVTDVADSFTNWNVFVSLLLEDLLDRPIRLPAKAKEAEAIVARMLSAWNGYKYKHWPRAIFFLREEREDGSFSFVWNVEMAAPQLTGGDSYNLRGGMQMTESLSAFARG
ncbi:hypothetical protein [Bradyrhizobium sp. SZCCHNR1051]|uniref:hypothetical protein n=1 Tax=Bradyrhizobium sp. SZCCHNR1051 TaxID=3057355 RepID=UPI00291609D2|nr:hypothetical protein [Bradyrhizobium sp. SZCCHNR1051]